MNDTPGDTVQSVMGALLLYFNVFIVLQRELHSGAYPPDVPLLCEGKLAKRFDASRVTIRHATSILEKERLILRKRGKDTFAIDMQAAQPKNQRLCQRRIKTAPIAGEKVHQLDRRRIVHRPAWRSAPDSGEAMRGFGQSG